MTEPVKAAQEAVTFPRTILVLRVIMSSSDSRSKVAHWSGKTHEVTTIANMRQRFTQPIRACGMPANPIDNTEVKLLPGLSLFPCDTALGHPVPGRTGHRILGPVLPFQPLPGRTISIGTSRWCLTGLIVVPKIRSFSPP